MTITTERASNTSTKTSPVSAVPFAGTASERELPTIELTHASLTDVEIAHHAAIQEKEEDSAVVATVVEQIPISVRDIDVEGGYSTRAMGNHSGRGEFVSGTFLKANRHVSLGFSLHKNGNDISSIAAGSLASASPLRVGDKIFSINNKQCSTMSRAAICKFLGGLVGIVTIVAHNEGGSSDIVESMITKSTSRELVGLAVAVSGSRLVVTKVNPGRTFVNSLLNVGDQVLSINDVSCENLPAAAAVDIIKESPKHVTVVAKTLSNTGVVVAQVSTRNTNTASPSSVSPAQARAQQQVNRRRSASNQYGYTDNEIGRCLFIPILIIIFVILATILGTRAAEEEENSYQFGSDTWTQSTVNWNDDNNNNDNVVPESSWNDDNFDGIQVTTPSFSWNDDNA